MDEIKAVRLTLGGIQSWWISLPGEPLRCGGDCEYYTLEQAIDNVRQMAAAEHRRAAAEQRLRERQPGKQIYEDYVWQAAFDTDADRLGLPEHARIVYCLKERRKAGRYQILDWELVE